MRTRSRRKDSAATIDRMTGLARAGVMIGALLAGASTLSSAAAHPVTPLQGHTKAFFAPAPLPVVERGSLLASLKRAASSRRALHGTSRTTTRTEKVSGSVSDLQKLQIPFSSFPANAIQKTGTPLPKASVDNPSNGVLFTDPTFHRQAYGTHGVLGAYDESAQINFGHYDNFVSVEWLGSYYSSPQFAASRVDDAVNTLTSKGVRAQSCYLDGEPNCHLFIWDIFGNYFAYAIWSNDNAVGELAFVSSPLLGPGSMIPNEATLGQDFKTLMRAGDTALIAAGAAGAQSTPSAGPPPSPTITIDKLQVLHIVKGRYKAARQIHVNETASFLAYFHVSSVGTYDPSTGFTFYSPRATLSMLMGGQSIYEGKPEQLVTPAGLFYFDLDGTFTDTSAQGKVTERFTLSLGASTATKEQTITVGPPQGTTVRR